MADKKIPVYAVCGADAGERLAFFKRFCRSEHPLWVQWKQSEPDTPQGVCSLPEDVPLPEAGDVIARQLADGDFDAVWISWEDEKPIDRLLTLLGQTQLVKSCKLRKVVRCGDGEADTDCMGDSALRQQFAQCDLFAVSQQQRKALRQIRHRLLPLQPNMEVISLSDGREIEAILQGRNVLQGIRFLFILVVVGALLAALNRLHYSVPNSMAVFLGTYLQALPFLLLGILLSSAIQVFVPADLLQRIFPKKLFGGMLFGVLGGFILPICDCASIPVFRSLVRKGVPLPAAVTFMIAAPIINPVVMLSTYYAFGANLHIMLTRMGFGIVCSVLIGLCFAWDRKSVLLAGAAAPVCACCVPHAHSEACSCGHEHADECEHEHDHDHADEHGHEHHHSHGHYPLKEKLKELVVHFHHEFFEVARFLLIGIGVSTVLQLVMGNSLNSMQYDSLLVSMLVMMALAFLLSLCSSSDAVVGKNMGTSLPLGAVMSFMVFGPMIDIKNMILMASSFTKRFMVKLLIATFVISFVTVYVTFTLGLGGLIA